MCIRDSSNIYHPRLNLVTAIGYRKGADGESAASHESVSYTHLGFTVAGEPYKTAVYETSLENGVKETEVGYANGSTATAVSYTHLSTDISSDIENTLSREGFLKLN